MRGNSHARCEAGEKSETLETVDLPIAITRQTVEKTGYAYTTRCRLESCNSQSCRKENNVVLPRRVPPHVEGRTDRRLQRGDLETLQKMGRHTDRGIIIRIVGDYI